MAAISPSPISGPNLTSPNDQPNSWALTGLSTADLERAFPPIRTASLFQRIVDGVGKRWRRELRRRQVGRAYDMALEIARALPRSSQVLDVGCGNGYIAHHLSSLLGAPVTGIDLSDRTDAHIPYNSYDGQRFPLGDRSFDAALCCYVLHHAQDLKPIFSELRRTLRENGLLVIYEDLPRNPWDRIVCAIHDRKWRRRTGPCTFRGIREWRDTFAAEGFELCTMRPLSRWRKAVHPVSRQFFLLKKSRC